MTTNNETTTTVSKKAPRVKYNYPFQSKAEILASQADFATCCEHLVQLYRAQTDEEQAKSDTIVKNRRGFMSSHAVNGSKLALKVIAGEELSGEEQDKVRGIVCRYGTQLAKFAREKKIAENPELKEIASIFSAD